MCKIDTILSPAVNVPLKVRRVKRSMPIRQIQYNSDVLREMARICKCSISDIIPKAAQEEPSRILRKSYKNQVAARLVAKQMLNSAQ